MLPIKYYEKKFVPHQIQCGRRVNTYSVSTRVLTDKVVLSASVADPDTFDTDPDPAFQSDTDPDPTSKR
jgi:hypothetical protein